MSNIYMTFFSFPILHYTLKPAVVLEATLANAAAAIIGTLVAVRAAARLQPAEAMRPEPPVRYRESILERVGLKRLLSQPMLAPRSSVNVTGHPSRPHAFGIRGG